jgi:hypothetical protein
MGETVMKTRKPTQAKCVRKTSDGIIAKRYLDLQKLRDEVRKAESSCGLSLNADQTTTPLSGGGIKTGQRC